MPKKQKLKDYRTVREKIDNPLLLYPSNVAKYNQDRLFISIPKKIQQNMRISQFNRSDFRVIIIRKEAL